MGVLHLNEYSNIYNSVIFTIVNKGYIDIGTNFLKRIKQLNMFNKMIFVCTDEDSFRYFNNDSYISCVYRESENVGMEFVAWGEQKYHDLVFNKFDITKEILELALAQNITRVLYIDTDIWCFTNFEKQLFDLAINIYPHADFIMQDGENYRLCPVPIKFIFKDTVLIKDRTSKRHCTGFMLMKPSSKTIYMFDYKNNIKVDYTKFVGNQPFFNKVAEIKSEINIINLERELGLNGSLFNDENAVERLNNDEAKVIIKSRENTAWFLHYTYISGKEKINKMKQFSHWL
jgi:hypothetical protein